jgi:fructokinase
MPDHPLDPQAAAPASLLGIDLGGTKIEAVVLDARGGSAWKQRLPTPAGDYDATLDAIADLVAQADAAAGRRHDRMGIGTPGHSTRAGLVKNANSTCLNGRPLRADLERRLDRPVRLANDANCLALSEATDGAAAGAAVVFAAILGTGVGAGLSLHGRLHEGPNGVAGEWGHNPLPWPDADEQAFAPTCWCGRRGCIETWLSGPGLARDHLRHAGEAADAATIAARALNGDAACAATLQRHAGRLARALATVVNVLDPDVIVLGGGLSRLNRLADEVARRWTPHVFGAGPDEPVRTRLVRSHHGDASGVRGAAWLWRD